MKKISLSTIIIITLLSFACIAIGISLSGFTKIIFNNNDEWFLIIMDIKNTGLALSFMKEESALFLAGIQGLSLLIIGLLNIKNKGQLIGWTLMMSGGIANLFERLVFGQVTDYIYIGFFGFKQFPIFNLADLLIIIGAFLFLKSLLSFKKEI